MNDRFNSSGKLLAIILVTATMCGCKLLEPAESSDDELIPHVRGRWIGTVQAITLYDTASTDNTYQATALHIEEGPAPPHPVPIDFGGGRSPILTRLKRSNLRIIGPDELMPGQRIEISGVMGFNHALNPHPYIGTKKGEAFLQRRPHQPGDMHVDHIIGIQKLVVIEPDGKRRPYTLIPKLAPAN